MQFSNHNDSLWWTHVNTACSRSIFFLDTKATFYYRFTAWTAIDKLAAEIYYTMLIMFNIKWIVAFRNAVAINDEVFASLLRLVCPFSTKVSLPKNRGLRSGPLLIWKAIHMQHINWLLGPPWLSLKGGRTASIRIHQANVIYQQLPWLFLFAERRCRVCGIDKERI